MGGVVIAAYIIAAAYVLFAALLAWEKRPQSSARSADRPIGPPPD